MRLVRRIQFVIQSTILLALLGSPTIAAAQDSPQNESLPQIVERFGGSWIGEGVAPGGETFTSKLVFQWTLNRNFIKVANHIHADGPEELFAVTFYGWQPVLRQVVFWSFDQSGAINEGVAELNGNELRHEWRSFEKNGEIKDWRSTLNREGEDTLTFTITDEKSKETYTVEYRRQK